MKSRPPIFQHQLKKTSSESSTAKHSSSSSARQIQQQKDVDNSDQAQDNKSRSSPALPCRLVHSLFVLRGVTTKVVDTTMGIKSISTICTGGDRKAKRRNKSLTKSGLDRTTKSGRWTDSERQIFLTGLKRL